MALLQSQVLLHCARQEVLYAVVMTLGKRIKLARKRLVPELTQKDIGDEFGITDKAVSSWERGETDPEPDKLPKLRALLKVPYIWLMEGIGDPPPPDDIQAGIESLSSTERAAVNALIESLLRSRRRRAG